MALTIPDDMEKLVYFTRRKLEGGKVIAWVNKIMCPKCGKGLMAKPKDSKTGKPKIRATEYVCEVCGYTEGKKEHEEKLIANAVYDCPHCHKKGESSVPYKRKMIAGVLTLRIQCEHCNGNIDITKKMKEPKKK